MPNRIIKSTSHAAGQALNDTIGSLFALELFAPSQSIFLISPWITDFAVLNNAYGQFRILMPEISGQVRLSAVLNSLAEQGVKIYVLSQMNNSDEFIQRLHSSIQRKSRHNLHEKSLLTDHFYLRGSMNFTYSGVNRNDEHVELSTDPNDLAQARVAAQFLWQETPK